MKLYRFLSQRSPLFERLLFFLLVSHAASPTPTMSGVQETENWNMKVIAQKCRSGMQVCRYVRHVGHVGHVGHVCMFVCLFVCMSVCLYVCMFVCMYECL